ncbi:hypothetical protein BKA81DRAFT_4818 [Phyllosticta paracitricarpa]
MLWACEVAMYLGLLSVGSAAAQQSVAVRKGRHRHGCSSSSSNRIPNRIINPGTVDTTVALPCHPLSTAPRVSPFSLPPQSRSIILVEAERSEQRGSSRYRSPRTRPDPLPAALPCGGTSPPPQARRARTWALTEIPRLAHCRGPSGQATFSQRRLVDSARGSSRNDNDDVMVNILDAGEPLNEYISALMKTMSLLRWLEGWLAGQGLAVGGIIHGVFNVLGVPSSGFVSSRHVLALVADTGPACQRDCAWHLNHRAFENSQFQSSPC